MAKKQSPKAEKQIQTVTAEAVANAPTPSKPSIDWLFWIYLTILLGIFIVQYGAILDTKVSAAGDNADYYLLGKALMEGKGYRTTMEVGEPLHNHFPPGYPVILSLLMRLFTTEYATLVLFNGIFFIGAIGIGLKVFNNTVKNIHIPFVAGILCLFNYYLLQYSTALLSEIPFLFFSMAAIFSFIRLDATKNPLKNPYFFLFLALTVACFYIRTAGIALAASFLLTLLVKKEWKVFAATAIGYVALVLPWIIRGARIGGDSYVEQLIHVDGNSKLPVIGFSDFTVRIWHNILRYIAREIPDVLFPWTEKPNYQAIIGSEYPINLLLLAVICFGLFRLKQHRVLFTSLTITTFAIVLCWPEIWFGIRFILPFAPFLLLFLVNGMYELGQILFKQIKWQPNFLNTVLWAFVPLLCLPKLYFSERVRFADNKTIELAPCVALAQQEAQNENKNIVKAYYDASVWCKSLPDDAVVLCRKPSLFHLFSDKKVVPLATIAFTDEEMKTLSDTVRAERYLESLQQKKITHAIFDALSYPETKKYLLPTVQLFPQKFPVIYKTPPPETYVLKFEPNK